MFRNFISSVACIFVAASSVSAFTHSELRTYTGEECGIAGHESSAREACGVARYRSDRGEACGPERYISRSDASCPGSDPGSRVITAPSYRGQVLWNKLKGGSTVQGGEDIQTIINQSGIQFRNPPYARKDTTYWSCVAKLVFAPSDGVLECTAKPYLASCEKPEFGVALWTYCENRAFGVLSYNTCEDPTKPIYGTCQIRKTNTEVESYVYATANDIDYNARLYAANLGAFLARIQDKIQMACLIDTYQDKPQFSPIISDLINKWEGNFGEIYEPGTYSDQCNSAVPPTPGDVSFQDKKCSAITSEDVKNGVKNSSDPAEKRFYQNCFAQKAYELPKSWFQFQLEEISLLLDDAAAKNSESTRQSLLKLQSDLNSAHVVDAKGN